MNQAILEAAAQDPAIKPAGKPDSQGPEEHRLVFGGVSWQQYEAMQALFEEIGGARLSYLEKDLEIMSPISKRHESIKKRIAMLLECFFQENGTQFFPAGSTSLQEETKRAGKEPDESYAIGEDKENPDLVVEVALTSGGINKLEIYRRYGVQEVWFCFKGALQLYGLRNRGYVELQQSELLPQLEMALFQKLLDEENPLRAVTEFRKAIKLQSTQRSDNRGMEAKESSKPPL